jgi:hypothetical protein
MTTYRITAPLEVTITVELGESQTLQDFIKMTDRVATNVSAPLDSLDAETAILFWQKRSLDSMPPYPQGYSYTYGDIKVSAAPTMGLLSWEPKP